MTKKLLAGMLAIAATALLAFMPVAASALAVDASCAAKMTRTAVLLPVQLAPLGTP